VRPSPIQEPPLTSCSWQSRSGNCQVARARAVFGQRRASVLEAQSTALLGIGPAATDLLSRYTEAQVPVAKPMPSIRGGPDLGDDKFVFEQWRRHYPDNGWLHH
jgi:hypothetical protein